MSRFNDQQLILLRDYGIIGESLDRAKLPLGTAQMPKMQPPQMAVASGH